MLRHVLPALVLWSCATSGDPDELDEQAQTAIVEGSPDAIGVLAVANALDVPALDDDVGLDARAARNIVGRRTSHGAFTTIAQLDAVSYVGKTAFDKLLAYAHAHGYVPAPGRQVSTCPGQELRGTAVCGDAAWDRDRPSVTGEHLRASYSFGEDDVWAAGERGTVLHFDGTTWRAEDTPICERIEALWGTSSTNLWAVGAYGRVLHRTAAGWRLVESGSCSTFTTVWGTSANDVWISTTYSDGVTLHGGAQGFVTVPDVKLEAIDGFASDDIWGVDGGTLYHYDGTSWSAMYTQNAAFHDIYAADQGHLFVAGFNWANNGNSVWQFAAATPGSPTERAMGNNVTPSIAGSSASDVWFVTGQQLHHFDGTTWRYVAAPGTHELWDLAVAAPSAAWAVGSGGDILRWNGSGWSEGNQTRGVFGLWAASETQAWAATTSGLLHLDAVGWSKVPGVTGFYYGVWGASPTHVYAVGPSNRIVHFDGATWTPVSGPTGSWWTVSGTSTSDVWVAGAQGTIAHFDGTTWTSSRPTTNNIYKLVALAPDDVWAATERGLLHFDGTSWASAGPLNAGRMLHVWGSADHLWAAGASGVWRWNGSVWTQMLPGSVNVDYTAVWGTGASDVWVAQGVRLSGYPTHLLHWDGGGWTTHVNAAADRVWQGLTIGATTWVTEWSGGILRLAR